MSKRYPKSPTLRVVVTEEQIEYAKARDSGHCMIAEAIKVAYPNATKVSVDLQTCRFSDAETNLRFVYLTPRAATVPLVQFDQEITPEPFSFTLSRGQVTRRRSGYRPPKLMTEAELAQRKHAGEKGRESMRKEVNLPERATLVNRGGYGNVPDVVGGKPPPLAPLARRRSFGLRALRL